MKKKFLHISDTHFRWQYPAVSGGYGTIFSHMTLLHEQLDECLREIDPSSLDFVLLTGDLTENGDAQDYACLKQLLKKKLGEVPLCVTPGNHDKKSEFYKGWLRVEKGEAPYNAVTSVGDVSIISLDSSSANDHDGIIGKDQCDWLRGTLEQNTGKTCLLMTHHHLLSGQHEIPPATFSDEFREIVEQSDIRGIFCGHTHRDYHGQFAGKPYFTSGSLSFCGKSREDGHIVFEERSSANLFELSDQGLAVWNIPIMPRGKLLCVLPGSTPMR